MIADSSSVFLLRYYIASASSLEILPNYVFTSRQKAKSIIPILSSIDIQLLPSGDYILGIQAVGSQVAELHGEFILALEMGALLEDVADTVHAHPTMTEAFHESVLKTLGHAIHTT